MEDECAISFEEILLFTTGLKNVQPSGFPVGKPSIEFLQTAGLSRWIRNIKQVIRTRQKDALPWRKYLKNVVHSFKNKYTIMKSEEITKTQGIMWCEIRNYMYSPWNNCTEETIQSKFLKRSDNSIELPNKVCIFRSSSHGGITKCQQAYKKWQKEKNPTKKLGITNFQHIRRMQTKVKTTTLSAHSKSVWVLDLIWISNTKRCIHTSRIFTLGDNYDTARIGFIK